MPQPKFIQYKKSFTQFYQKYHRLPTYAEMLNLFKFKSKNAVARVVQKLIDAEIVAKDENGKLIPLKALLGVQLVGNIQAGLPTDTEQQIGEIVSLDEFLINDRQKTYLLEVNGDSMIDAGIQEGDLVIVEQGRQPRIGEIVIAEVDHEWTLKYFAKEGKRTVLKPGNKNYPMIRPVGELRIGGVVTGVIRKY